MAHFTLPGRKFRFLKLAAGTTRLFASGNSGMECLVLQVGKKVTLLLTGSNVKATVSQVTLGSTFDYVFRAARPMTTQGPAVLSVSVPQAEGQQRAFTVTAIREGKAALVADGAEPLLVFAGNFRNHTGMEHDLIANVFRDSDPVKTHILTRTLYSNWDNHFNEQSEYNQTRWCKDYVKKGKRCLPCGTVSKAGSNDIFHNPIEYDYQTYHKPIPGMNSTVGRANVKREDLKYDEATLRRGCQAIRKRLSKGMPSVVGLVYDLQSAIRSTGQIDVHGTGGHSVPIVGCDDKAEKFLYIDVYPDGSKLQYLGGHGGLKMFPECTYLGMFELKHEPTRSSFMLRTQKEIAEASGVFFKAPNSFLEVVSGPLTG